MRAFVGFLLISIIVVSSCNIKEQAETEEVSMKDTVSVHVVERARFNEIDLVNLNAVVIAQPIIYPTIIKNPDKSDDWTEQCLEKVDIEALATVVFSLIYDGKTAAYEYRSDRELTIQEVKLLEKEYSRDRIGKLLFTEEWYFDDKAIRMGKKVTRLMIAYELYDSDNNVKGYKAGFYINLNTANDAEVINMQEDTII